jgi:hypothetical protein
MLKRNKNKGNNTSSLLASLISEASTSLEADSNLSIVEFAEDILFNSRVNLFPQQRAVLKIYNNEDINEDEENILNEWFNEGKTTWRKGRVYSDLVLEAGRGSGKSVLAAIIVLYEFYKLISLKEPALFYGLIPNDPISIFVIAKSGDQVKETLYAKIKGYAEQSEYFKALVDNEKITIQEEMIRCKDKNIAIYAKHTNSSSLVGYTLKCLVLDEVARFDTRLDEYGDLTSAADDIFYNVGKGVKRFGAKGRRVAISSAWRVNDPIERLLKTADKDPETIGFKLCTWDINKRPESTRQSLNSEYLKDLTRAQLEYEGIRINNKGSSFILEELIDKCTKGLSMIDTKEINLDIGDRGYVGQKVLRIEKDRETPCFIHIDFSVKRDATGLAIAYPYKVDDRYLINVGGLIKWTPYTDDKGKKRLINFNNIEEVLMILALNRNILKMTFDSFSSAPTIQKLYTLGIDTQEVSVSRSSQAEYFTLFRDLLNQELVILPKDSIYFSSLKSELLGIKMNENLSISHGLQGKDISDAVVNSVFQCYNYIVNSGLTFNNTNNILVNPSLNSFINIINSPYNIGSSVNRYRSLKYKRLI